MQRIKIDVTKLDKSAFFKGAKGTYADITLMENRDGVDQYGNDGFVVQDIGKQRREAGEKGPIIGNWQHVGQPSNNRPRNQNGAAPPASAPADDFEETDEIPF